MRLVLLFLLLFCLLQVFAQNDAELIELDTAKLSDSAWLHHLNSLLEMELPLKLDSRLQATDTSSYSLHSALYEQNSLSVLFNARRDWEKDRNHLNFSSRIKARGGDTRIGAWRMRFGRGLVLAYGSRSLPDSAFSLLYPGSAGTYSPLGAAVKVSRGAWQGGFFGSVQQREARLSGGYISSLPKTHSGLLPKAEERIFGTTLAWQHKRFQIAVLNCRQSYSRPFLPAKDLLQKLWIHSLYASWEQQPHRLDAEWALIGGEPSGLINWQYRFGRIRQSLSYARSNIQPGQLPYALAPAVLNSAPQRSEYSYDLQLPLPLHTSLLLRYSLNHGSTFSADQFSRLAATLSYRHAKNSLKLSFFSFDRDIITLLDSTYVPLEPRNHRLVASGKYYILPRLFQQMELSYSLEDKADYRKNTYRAGIFWGYEGGKLRLKAGILSWQSPRSFIAYDEDSPDYYSICANDDNQLSASASYALKGLRVSASGRKSLLHPGEFNLWLRLGFSL